MTNFGSGYVSYSVSFSLSSSFLQLPTKYSHVKYTKLILFLLCHASFLFRNITWINIEEDEMSYGSSSRHNG
jgi:hypothetical protein